MKTYQPKKDDIKRKWHLIDVSGQILGRVASGVAVKLMGKNKADYSAHMDSGDYVVVINSKEVKVTGRKESQKVYRNHSGYPGGLKTVTFERMRKTDPNRIVEKAVYGMLPDNRLKAKRMARLKIFAGDNHPYREKFEAGKK